jgi:hypothetical protein
MPTVPLNRKLVPIFSRMVMEHTRLVTAGYHRDGKSPTSLTTELMIAIAVAACDPDDEACSVSEIARDLRCLAVWSVATSRNWSSRT